MQLRSITLASLVLVVCCAAAPTTQPTKEQQQMALLKADNLRMQKEITDLREQVRKQKVQLANALDLLKKADALLAKVPHPEKKDGLNLGDSYTDSIAWLKLHNYRLIHDSVSEHVRVMQVENDDDEVAILTFENGILKSVTK